VISFKKFVKEAYFDVSGASSRTTQLKRPAQTGNTASKTNIAPGTPQTAISTAKPTSSVVQPSAKPIAKPEVTARNAPVAMSGKNGQLQQKDLVKVGKYDAEAPGLSQWYKDDAYLAPRAAKAFLSAQQAYGGPIKINSAYRNTDHQAGLRGKYAVVGKPGSSKHGLGNALDLQRNTPEYAWMQANGPKFGWYYAQIPGDPHHFEYRG
jgi:LAS superfamily LD-carboxypeptidase LdcB